MSTPLAELALAIPCSYCGAQPGQKCLTRHVVTRGMSREVAIKHYGPSGTATYPHTARTRPVWRIYETAWRECQDSLDPEEEA